MSSLSEAFYKAKWDHYVDQTLSRFKLRASEYDREIAEEVENDMKERVELMYSYDDIVHDRHILRNRFLHEMNKKTTLRDIGAKLDEFVLDSKANMGQYYQLNKTPFDVPNAATRDQTTVDFDWKQSIIQGFESVKPLYIEDKEQLEADHPREKMKK